jgi:hypothetical protein
MPTGTTSRAARLLALMNKGDDVHPVSRALPGISHPQGRTGLRSRLRSRSLAVCADHATCVTPGHPVGQAYPAPRRASSWLTYRAPCLS